MGKKRRLSLSSLFLILLLLLCAIGLFFVFEASIAESFSRHGHQYHYFSRQLQWFGVGLFTFFLGWAVPTSLWKKISPVVYLLATLLLFLPLIPELGVEINGARRWFVVAGVSIQPVEFFKVALILFFSSWLSRHQRLLPLVASLLLPSIALLLQPDFGSLLIVLFLAIGIYFIAGGSIKRLMPMLAVGVLLMSLAVFTSPYRLRRVKSFLDPEHDPLGASFQIRQITLALGSGGLFGQGLGNSQQRYAFIPEASSDSIFAIVAEEVGFIGSFLILALFASYINILFRVSLRLEENSFQQFLVSGLWLWVAGQTLLNLAAVVALVPLTGLTLPYFSYGGSSLVSLLFLNGVGYRLARLEKE